MERMITWKIIVFAFLSFFLQASASSSADIFPINPGNPSGESIRKFMRHVLYHRVPEIVNMLRACPNLIYACDDKQKTAHHYAEMGAAQSRDLVKGVLFILARQIAARYDDSVMRWKDAVALFMHNAECHNISAMATMLTKYPNLIYACDNEQQTALHRAVKGRGSNSNEVVIWLSNRGCDVNAKNNIGATALHSCIGLANKNVVNRSTPYLNIPAFYTLMSLYQCNPFLQNNEKKTVRNIVEGLTVEKIQCSSLGLVKDLTVKELLADVMRYEKEYKNHCAHKISHRNAYGVWYDILFVCDGAL